MSVLVDTSVWVEFLRGGVAADDRLEWLIDEGLVLGNDLIMSELLPPLIARKEDRLVRLLREVPRLALEIDWQGIIEDQVTCLKHGINRVGVPDLIIAQNARRHQVPLFTFDKHFRLLAKHTALELF